ncbi:hypothetical protein [Haloprofundus marisrubri]|uniref:hypothetical protein n=1 Tax=Haloprofundus marisrubri TaxID=1514971 RepID=UPI0012BA68AF|nr:hypothetical protein [Haloprofundus marisrubri]
MAAEDGYYLIGTARHEYPMYRGLVIRVDTAGHKQWQQEVALSSTILNAGSPHPRGGVMVTGVTNLSEPNYSEDTPLSSDPFLARITDEGTLEWTRTLQPTAGAGRLSAVSQTNGGYLVGGSKQARKDTPEKLWAAYISNAGHQQWSSTLAKEDQKGTLNAVSADGDVWYVGGSVAPAQSDDYGRSENAIITCLNRDGTVQWRYEHDELNGSRIESLHTTANGVVGVGNRGFAVDNDGEGWHFQLTTDGDVEWTQSHTTGPWNWLQDSVALDGSYLLVGTREEESEEDNGPRGAWVLKTGPTGDRRWETTYFDGESSSGRTVQRHSEGGFVIGGRTDVDSTTAGWLLNVGGSEADQPSITSDPLSNVTNALPPETGAVASGAVIGGTAVALGQRLLSDDG